MLIMGQEINPNKVVLVSDIFTNLFNMYVNRDTYSFAVKQIVGEHYEDHKFISHDRKKLEAERNKICGLWHAGLSQKRER